MSQLPNNETIKYFQVTLLNWYKLNGRKFPWRKSGLSNYKIIISEILLQRTRAETVAKFYPIFIKRFPSWESLSGLTENNIANTLKGIGLQNQRAKRLKALAIEMVKRNGRLPKTYDELLELPFFGQYIANAVMLLVHTKPYPLLDVNMSRILERIFGNRKLADIRYDPYLQKIAKFIITDQNSKILNWAILDYAHLICSPKPKCEICVFRSICLHIK